MPLITCPDCEKQISDVATSCPNCGRPVHAIIIEQTAKKWKGMKIMGTVVVFLGFVLVIFGIAATSTATGIVAVLVILLGIGIRIYAGTASWWHHG